LLLDGSGHRDETWLVGPLVAIDPQVVYRARAGAGNAIERGLEELDRVVAARRETGGPPETGVAALFSYDLFDREGGHAEGPADLTVLTVDRSLRFAPGRTPWLTERGADGARLGERVLAGMGAEAGPAARGNGAPRTSLPREAYLRAVGRLKEHIARGDVYQGNLCQQFRVRYAGDSFEAYACLARSSPAPRSAYLEADGFALASLSPETFVCTARPGELVTLPIKGTRPRGATLAADRAAAEALRRSEKDQAELLMIVDLERNDLSRICRAGTVEVTELAGLRSYPAVHHLVARVRGRLASGVGAAALLRATFPGGSITGAPKIRAMEILRDLEPVRRGPFTGSLFWFGDDGRLDSSILIRSWVFGRELAWLGAGGGIVADSEPEAEWQESNHKARALTAALGFDPEEAL